MYNQKIIITMETRRLILTRVFVCFSNLLFLVRCVYFEIKQTILVVNMITHSCYYNWR